MKIVECQPLIQPCLEQFALKMQRNLKPEVVLLGKAATAIGGKRSVVFQYVVRMSSIMQLAVFLQDQLHKECYWVDSEGFLVELATMIYELWEIRIIEDMRCRQISN